MNIGLVLSGGMAKGAYQIGALKALNNFIPLSQIKCISCASVGVLNGYAFATQNLEQAEEMWRNVCCDNARAYINQILRSSMLQKSIKDLCAAENTLQASFYASLLDFSKKTLIYKDLATLDREQMQEYLKASVAMPVYNHAVRIDDAAYFDGAMVDNIPVYPLMQHELDYLICFYFADVNYKFESTEFDSKIIKVTFPTDSRIKQSLVMNPEGIDRMIKEGFDRTEYVLNSILAKGYDNLDHIYRAIELANLSNANKKLRITGDVLMTNLNKVTQRFAKRKIIV